MALDVNSLTPEQKGAVSAEGNVYLSACPGSGKTKVLIAKLLSVAAKLDGTARRVGCITYTNAGVDEIDRRLAQFGSWAVVERCTVETIHSFCLQEVLRPYSWLDKDVKEDFKVLTPRSFAFEGIVREVEEQMKRRFNSNSLYFYQHLRSGADGKAQGTAVGAKGISDARANCYWNHVRKSGYLDFSLILFHARRILREHEFVRSAIASRFAWLLIDEYQDTTEIQLDIFREIHSIGRTKFFVVGDNNQSIMGFAGASVSAANAFIGHIDANSQQYLTGNFRCSKKIVSHANQLMPDANPMRAVGENQCSMVAPVWIPDMHPTNVLLKRFIPLVRREGIQLSECVVLAPQNRHLECIASLLRGKGIATVGPEHYPFISRTLFSKLLPYLATCVNKESHTGLLALERELRRVIEECVGGMMNWTSPHELRTIACALIRSAKSHTVTTEKAARWINLMALDVIGALRQIDNLPESVQDEVMESANGVVSDLVKNIGGNKDDISIAHLGIVTNKDRVLKLMTVHKSKGREFDAVAIIRANDGFIPHHDYKKAKYPEEEINAGRRLLYVGMTRARKILMIASDTDDRDHNTPSRFMEEAGFNCEECDSDSGS